MLTGPASPLIRIIRIPNFDTSLFGHLILLLFLLLLLYFSLSALLILGPDQLRAIAVACSLPRHLKTTRVYNQSKAMLNPLKHLSGKLNHLRIPQTRFIRAVQLANSIRPGTSEAWQSATTESILELKSQTQHVDARAYHKFQFDLQVHTNSAVFSLPSTIFDDLNPFQRKISHLITSYTATLSPRHLLYLNLALRKKLNGEFPTWNTLHLSPESPSKIDLQVLPTLFATSRISELKSVNKKAIMKQVVKAKSAAH